MRIMVFDEVRQEFRDFEVVPGGVYAPCCGNGLHQFAPRNLTCACGKVHR